MTPTLITAFIFLNLIINNLCKSFHTPLGMVNTEPENLPLEDCNNSNNTMVPPKSSICTSSLFMIEKVLVKMILYYKSTVMCHRLREETCMCMSEERVSGSGNK